METKEHNNHSEHSIRILSKKNKRMILKHTTKEFKVWGYRFKCKARIENSLKIKGIKKAIWNRETKMLTVMFNPDIVLFEQIQASFSMVAK